MTEPRRCKFAQIIESLDDSQKERVTKALNTVSVLRLSYALKQWDYRVSSEMIRRHRIGMCVCD
jgi:hypothetical protein